MASAEVAYRVEKESIWDWRLAKAGVVLVGAGFLISLFKIKGAVAAASVGVSIFLAGLSWNWTFGKGKN